MPDTVHHAATKLEHLAAIPNHHCAMDWAALLLDGPVRAEFLAGVCSTADTKAAFKCGHLAQQLRVCATLGPDSATPHDQKVCEIVRWEQLLCWSRYVALSHFEAVRQCYHGKTLAEREVCDPAVFELHATVEQRLERVAGTVTAAERAAIAGCPKVGDARSEADANAALSCLARSVWTPQGERNLAACLAGPDRAACAATHSAMLQSVGLLYGKSLVLSAKQ
jgi:hypothetical protein